MRFVVPQSHLQSQAILWPYIGSPSEITFNRPNRWPERLSFFMTIDELIDEIIAREGGFVDHPADKGSATKYGITLATLADYRRKPTSADDVRNLTEDEAREIYKTRYIYKPRLHVIAHEMLRGLAADISVHHGPGDAVRWLQELVGVNVDGKLGPLTEAAINAAQPAKLFIRLVAIRFRDLGKIITYDRRLKAAKAAGFRLQAENAAGWNDRVSTFLDQIAEEIGK